MCDVRRVFSLPLSFSLYPSLSCYLFSSLSQIFLLSHSLFRSLILSHSISFSLILSLSLFPYSLSLFLSRFLSYFVSSLLTGGFIARYLFRPPLAVKSRGDRKRRHENFVSVFSTTMKTSRQIDECHIFRERT